MKTKQAIVLIIFMSLGVVITTTFFSVTIAVHEIEIVDLLIVSLGWLAWAIYAVTCVFPDVIRSGIPKKEYRSSLR